MYKVRISIIVALDEKRGIGKDNALMWKIPGELARFKEITMGHPIIMGRKTFESIGRVLPGRTNIIITRDSNYKVKGAVVVNSLDDAIKRAMEEDVSKDYSSSEAERSREVIHEESSRPFDKTQGKQARTINRNREIFIIGGGQIFEQALPLADRLYLTLVKGDFHADVFFPDYTHDFTKEIIREEKELGEYTVKFLTLERG